VKITALTIADVLLIEPLVFADERGFFFESFNHAKFEQAIGRHVQFVQDNHSKSLGGVLRGLHFQKFKHHVRKVSRKEFETDMPRIFSAMDQPSIDGINTWYASKAVAELDLKVVISGVGGDELFYGYPSFHQLPKLVSGMNK